MKNNTRYSLSSESFLSPKGNRLCTPEYGKPITQVVKTIPAPPSFIANASSLNLEFSFGSARGCKNVSDSWVLSTVLTVHATKRSNLLSYPSLFRHLKRKYNR